VAGTAENEPVADQVAACSFDDPGGDRPACCQGLVVAEEFVLAAEVMRARIRAAPLAGGQSGGVGFGGDAGGYLAAVSGQHRGRFDRHPVLGCGIGGGVQAPRAERD
jgi:hypothetical protein